MKYLAVVPYGWAVDEDFEVALTAAQRFGGHSKRELNKLPHYILQFPDSAEITMTNYGQWRSTEPAVCVLLRKNLNEKISDDELMGKH